MGTRSTIDQARWLVGRVVVGQPVRHDLERGGSAAAIVCRVVVAGTAAARCGGAAAVAEEAGAVPIDGSRPVFELGLVRVVAFPHDRVMRSPESSLLLWWWVKSCSRLVAVLGLEELVVGVWLSEAG